MGSCGWSLPSQRPPSWKGHPELCSFTPWCLGRSRCPQTGAEAQLAPVGRGHLRLCPASLPSSWPPRSSFSSPSPLSAGPAQAGRAMSPCHLRRGTTAVTVQRRNCAPARPTGHSQGHTAGPQSHATEPPHWGLPCLPHPPSGFRETGTRGPQTQPPLAPLCRPSIFPVFPVGQD